MFTLSLVLFIVECFAFCYLFYKILEISNDIDVLYDKYSKTIESITKENIEKYKNKRGNVLK